jgi:hypothetical protein
MRGSDNFDELEKTISEIEQSSLVPSSERKALLEGWEHSVEQFLQDGIIDATEERRLVEFAKQFALSQSDLDKNGALTKTATAVVLRDVLDGILPQRFSVDETLPVNFQKGEQLVWAFSGSKYLEDKVRRHYTVRSQAPLLNPTDSSLGQVIDNRSIVELPLNGRNYLQLGILVFGLAPALKARWGDNTAAFAANGLRYTMNNYLLDGVDNNSQILNLQSGGAEITRPSIDAIQEFKSQTSNFSAEFGRSASAVVNVITKSGGNSFHGTAYEFHRNAVLDAKNFFDSPARPIPSFIQGEGQRASKTSLTKASSDTPLA